MRCKERSPLLTAWCSLQLIIKDFLAVGSRTDSKACCCTRSSVNHLQPLLVMLPTAWQVCNKHNQTIPRPIYCYPAPTRCDAYEVVALSVIALMDSSSCTRQKRRKANSCICYPPNPTY